MDAGDCTRRDLSLAAAAFLSGTLCLLAAPSVPAAWFSVVVGCLALGALLARRHHAAQLLAWACCGFLLADARAYGQVERAWPQSSADERVLAQVVVDSIPEPRGEGWSFDAVIHIEAPRPHERELRVRVISRDSSVRPRAGERWRLLLALRPPRAALNPGAIDHERLMFHEGIDALGTVATSRFNQRLGQGERPLAALRERIARHIEERVGDRDAASLIAALAVGATGTLSREQWRVFNATGTTHLVAISGLHVTLFAVVMLAAARRMWAAFLWRFVPWNRESFAAVFGLAAATGYAMLAGLSIPTQRTLIMLAAWLLARCVARNTSPLQPFAVALLAVLILDPFASLTAGFWLSFGAMGVIMSVTGTRFARRGALREAVAVQLAVAVLLVPFTLASFGSISMAGPLVNAVAIPYMSWLLVPVVLLGVVSMPVATHLSDLLFAAAEWLHDLAWPWLAAAADSPYALAYASPPFWWYILAACSVPLVFAPWPARVRLATALCVLPLMAAGHAPLPPGELEITALDMGEGTATVLRSSTHTLVYGTGESYGTGGGRSESVLVPFLRSRGASRVDRLVVPRLTPITGEGVTALFAALPVSVTSIGGAAPADFAGAEPCGARESWTWDGVGFRMLPSCELEVLCAGSHARLSADRVQVTGVHGASWAIVAGRGHRNGKLRPAAARAAQVADRVRATGDSGAIRIHVSPGGNISLQGQREERPAVWRSPPGPPPTLK